MYKRQVFGLVVEATSYASDGSYTISCSEATSVDAKITVQRSGCSFTITAGQTAGEATFTVPYSSTGGNTLSGTIAIAVNSPVVALSSAGCFDGTFVDLTANPRVVGANNDLVEDCQALVAAQNHWAASSSNNDIALNHALRTWGTGTATEKRITNWNGITVTDNRVKSLNLQGSSQTALKIESTIPSQLGNLTNLTRLDLSNNQLTGNIPTQLGSLTKATKIYISSNQLTGNIPTQLGNLSEATTLDLSANQLTSSIPSELGNLPKIANLYLSSNQLTGNIPTQLGNMTTTETLDLSNNQLTGNIPTQLGSLTQIRTLNLHYNQLSGSIPSELGSLTQIRFLKLHNNQLTGNIPTQLGNLAPPTGKLTNCLLYTSPSPRD